MAERPGSNPYSKPVARGDGSAPNPTGSVIWAGPGRYSVPDIPETTDPDYTLGFSPTLATTGSPDGTKLPDDIRIGVRKPPPNSPQNTEVYTRRYNEFYRRASVEKTTLGWHVRQEKPPPPRVPEWEQEKLPIRPTATLAPAGYMFQRPEHHPRPIKDAVGEQAVEHFSLADHRRTWEIFGQKPQGGPGVNTYRAPVRPWDENMFIPPQPANSVDAIFGKRARGLI